MQRRHFLMALGAGGGLGIRSSWALGHMMGEGGSSMTGRLRMGMMGAAPRHSSLLPVTGQPLFIPPLYTGEQDRHGVRHYKLCLAPSSHEVMQDAITDTWAVHSPDHTLPMLGPTLRLRQGEQVAIHYDNRLPETTTMHSHGLVLPGEMDGGPHQVIAPDQTWKARFQVRQPAATCWYHPHGLGKTAEQVYRGLAGLIYIEDAQSDSLSLPKTYGMDDIPLVIQDRVFDSAGQFYYHPSMHEIRMGYLGDVVLTNGLVSPQFEARQGLLRLRLLNGSNSEVWRIMFADRTPFALIAGDSSLLPAPIWVRAVQLSPGERVEIVVDLGKQAGEKLMLLAKGMRGGVSQPILQLQVSQQVAPQKKLPQLLRPQAMPHLYDLPQRDFVLGGMMRLTINGAEMDMDVINERIHLGQAEVWRVRNGMGMMHHNFHVHGGSFRILARNGRADAVMPHERGEKDTVYLPPGESALLWVVFHEHAPDHAPFMYHCHFLEHEDAGMMGQFSVI